MLVHRTLARRLELAEANLRVEYVAAAQTIFPQMKSDAQSIGGGYAIYTVPGSHLNRAVGLGMNGPVSSTQLEEVECFYNSRRAPTQLFVCPLAHETLLEALAIRGYRLHEFINVLVLDLKDYVPGPTPNSSCRVREVSSAEAELWARTVASGFIGARDQATEESLMIVNPSLHMPNARCFLASVGGEVTGGGVLGVFEKTAELRTTSTRIGYRNRGVQAALIRARLESAALAGCDLAMVMTSPGSSSQRNLERAGFRVAYTKAVMARS